MNAPRMLELSAKLGELYTARAQARILQWQHEQDAEARRVQLTPTGDDYKALGSNNDQRKASLEEIFANDETLKTIAEAVGEIRSDLETVQGEIDALEAERRALEWMVRARMVEALERNHVQPNHRGDPAYHAFDDAGDTATMDTLDAEADRRQDWRTPAQHVDIPF